MIRKVNFDFFLRCCVRLWLHNFIVFLPQRSRFLHVHVGICEIKEVLMREFLHPSYGYVPRAVSRLSV